MAILKVAILVGITVLLVSTQSTSAVRIDWTKLGGVDSRLGENETRSNFVGDIYGAIFGIWDEVNTWNLETDDDDDDDGNNSTSAPRSRYPPGLEGLGYVSSQCLNETARMVEDYYKGDPYAIKMIHSSGALPSAGWAITGSRQDYGLFDTCRDIKAAKDDAPFDAEYCLVSTRWRGGVRYAFGQCMPSSCSETDMYVLFEILKATLNLKWRYAYVFCEHPEPLDNATIGVIATCSVLGALMFVGTLYHFITILLACLARKKCSNSTTNDNTDDMENKKVLNGRVTSKDTDDKTRADMNIEEGVDKTDLQSPSKTQKCSKGVCDEIFMSFSVYHNLQKIFNTKKSPDMLCALNGMRVISMFWIILGHIWYIASSVRLGNSRLAYDDHLRDFFFQVVLNGVFAVDTFFMLSGLLVTYHTMKALTKSGGKLKWRYFYLHRYLRITPLYMFVIAVYITLPKYLGNGPFWNLSFTLNRLPCQFLWWTNLLYINNLFPFPGDLSTQCMAWSWYLADDMQFYVVSPLILVLLYRNRKFGFALILAFLLVSWSSAVGISVYYGLNVGLGSKKFNDRPRQNLDWLYTKPWYRCPPYLIGIVVGYVLFKLDGKKLNISWLTNAACWMMSAGVSFAVVFGIYNTSHGHELSQGLAVFHRAFVITAWGLTVGWVALACSKGYGGPINTILSWSIWIPLSRITFSAYLIHLIVLTMYFTGLRAPFYISWATMVIMFIGFAFVSYTVALLFSLVVEAPMRGLELLIFKRKYQKFADAKKDKDEN